MPKRGAFAGSKRRRRCGVAPLDRDLLAAPLRQPDAAPLEHVDRGYDEESFHAKVLAC